MLVCVFFIIEPVFLQFETIFYFLSYSILLYTSTKTAGTVKGSLQNEQGAAQE